MRRLGSVLTAAALVAGCTSMDPNYERPALAVPESWPVGDPYLRQSEASLPAVTYQQIFGDPRLQRLIETGLAESRDLRVAFANVATARAQFRVQRAARLPVLGVGASGTYSGSTPSANANTGSGNNASTDFTTRSSFSVDGGVSAFEIDLWGRVASLSRAEQNRYFASEAGARATRLTLVGDIADAWLQYGADRSLLTIAEQTVRSAEQSVRLTRARLEGGVAPRTDLRQAEEILFTAQADVAAQRTAIAQDVNALQLLTGAPVDPALLPASIEDAQGRISELPAGLDSRVLLRRPDVVQAEYLLRAANAEIGAARAALFPRITLTGLIGLASNALTGLFTGSAFNFSGGVDAGYTFFDGGAGRNRVRVTQAQRDAAVATYERSIQAAFRDVADALARRGTMAEELRATEARRAATADTYRLTEARYRGGIDSFLTSLDAQRALYTAERTLVGTRLTRASNLVALYRALGGDSLYPAPPPAVGQPDPAAEAPSLPPAG